MNKENEKQPIFLIFQGHIPISSPGEGEAIYNELKTFVKSWHENAYMSGQIIKHLEKCCGEQQKGGPRGFFPPFIK